MAVVRGKRRDYADHHPGPQDVALVVEVGDDSLVRDRSTKLPMYARAGVAQYWIVDVRARAIEVYRVPVDEGFSQETKYLDGDELVVELDGAVLGQLRVADLLP